MHQSWNQCLWSNRSQIRLKIWESTMKSTYIPSSFLSSHASVDVYPCVLPLPSVSSRSSTPISWILSPSQGFTLSLSNSNSETWPLSAAIPQARPLYPSTAFWIQFCWTTGLTRLKVGEGGAAKGATVWKLTQRPESTVDASDSSHSGIVAGVKCWRRVGLEGADTANRGWRNEPKVPFEMDSQSAFRFGPLEVGDERGGVTGALDILRRGKFVGTEAMLWRNGRM